MLKKPRVCHTLGFLDLIMYKLTFRSLDVIFFLEEEGV